MKKTILVGVKLVAALVFVVIPLLLTIFLGWESVIHLYAALLQEVAEL